MLGDKALWGQQGGAGGGEGGTRRVMPQLLLWDFRSRHDFYSQKSISRRRAGTAGDRKEGWSS